MIKIVERARTNLIETPVESWKPPLFGAETTRRDRIVAKMRRFADLPAGSIWRHLCDILPACSGTVLDVGCGAQPYRSLFPADATYRGIDTAEALEHFGYRAPDTTYFEGDRWPVDDGSVDVILSTETLEHVENVAAFLGEAARCARPGGLLVLTVPFAARWHFIPYDYWRFTPSGLKSVLKPHGFSAVYIWARGNALTVACYKAMALVLPFLFPTSAHAIVRLAARALGFLLAPLLVALAAIGNASLKGDGGDDCLGYTVVAVLGDPTLQNP